MIAAGYVRVSTNEQINGYSIPEQTERITAYCKAKGWELGKIYTDAGYSGAKLERPGIQQLLADCSKYNIIVVYKLDRLSRSQKDTLYLIETFKEKGAAFVSMCESFDTSTPFGIASVGIMSVFAQLEREQIKERMQMGRIGRAKSGKYNPANNVPIGYAYTDGKLVPLEPEAEHVRMIYDMFVTGKSMLYISKYMHARYTNRYGSYNTVQGIKLILTNPIYTGKMSFGGQLYDGSHEPIISEERFALAQQTMARRSQKNVGRSKHLLTGLLYCKLCGARLQYWSSKNINNKKYEYYVCSNRSKRYSTIERRQGEKCMLPYFHTVDLEKPVLEEVGKIELPEVRGPEPVDNSRELAQIDRQITKAMELFTLDQIDREKLEKMLEGLNKKKAALTEQQADMAPVILAAETAKTMMEKLNDSEKAEVLKLLISRIEVGPDTIEIYYTF